MDSNHRPQGYEPCELPSALPRNFILQTYEKKTIICKYINKKINIIT